jgi:hypothetical protein
MQMKRTLVYAAVAVVMGITAAAVMAWAAGSHPAQPMPMQAQGGGGGGCGMMGGAGKAAGGGACPMMSGGSGKGTGYLQANEKTKALWDKMGRLLDEHHRAMWRLFSLMSQKPVNQAKVAAARKDLAGIGTQMRQVRTQLAKYWKPTSGAVAKGPGQGMGCVGACPMPGGPCGAK